MPTASVGRPLGAPRRRRAAGRAVARTGPGRAPLFDVDGQLPPSGTGANPAGARRCRAGRPPVASSSAGWLSAGGTVGRCRQPARRGGADTVPVDLLQGCPHGTFASLSRGDLTREYPDDPGPGPCDRPLPGSTPSHGGTRARIGLVTGGLPSPAVLT